MSTRCLIGIKENDKVKYIYCHNDGYIEGGVGETLLRYYNYYDTVRLMELGDLSTLGEIPKSLKCLWDYNLISELDPRDCRELRYTYCKSYADRGETRVEAKEVDFDDFGFNCQTDANYIYLFDEEARSWFVKTDDSTGFFKLTL